MLEEERKSGCGRWWRRSSSWLLRVEVEVEDEAMQWSGRELSAGG